MKLSYYFMIFFTILLSAFLFMQYTTSVNTTISEEDEKYRELLYEATDNAMEAALEDVSYELKDQLWTPFTLSRAVEELNDTFELKLNYSINAETDTTNFLFPVVCFVDKNGFYLFYIGTENDHTAEDKKVLTNLNTWTVTQDGYSIQYYLGENKLTVTNNTGMTFTGSYDEVNAYFENPSFFRKYRSTQTDEDGNDIQIIDAESFNADKINTIIIKTEEIINYYLNNKDYTINKLGRHLELSLDINDDALHKAFENVGVITFLQGPVFQNTYSSTSIYAYAHYEVPNKPYVYAITCTEDGILIYHKQDCQDKDTQSYIMSVNTTKEAAALGASPCPSCY